VDPDGRALDGKPELFGNSLLDCPRCERSTNGDAAVPEIFLVQEPKDDIRVGQGGLGAASTVACRPGIGARAFRADRNNAAGIDPRDATTPSTNLDEVDGRDHQGQAAATLESANARHFERTLNMERPGAEERPLCGGPPHVV